MPTQSIGPWDGGLNLTSNRDLSPYLKNNELGIALNVELTPEGFIQSRPGFKMFDDPLNSEAGTTIKILGTIYISNQEIVVVQAKRTADVRIYYVDGTGAIVLKYTFANTVDFSSVLAINNADAAMEGTSTKVKGVFLFDSVASNTSWKLEETPTFSPAVGTTLIDAKCKVPKSDKSFSIKDRVFLLDKAGKLYWSALDINSLWFDMYETSNSIETARAKQTGFVSVSPSLDTTDYIRDAVFINNSFYLFKQTSTFMFTYQADPESDGWLRQISEELGAFDATIFRNTIVVINNRGVFSVEGTQFIDLQTKLNLRFEQYLDTVIPNAFITNFNGNLLCGYTSNGVSYYYWMNAANKGWTQWDFAYADQALAAPGSNAYAARTATGDGRYCFTTIDNTRLIYALWKPNLSAALDYDYALDGPLVRDSVAGKKYRYVPKINIQARTLLGDSVLNYKKLYRYYVRVYISDFPTSEAKASDATWDFSINYNDFYFNSAMNPKYQLIITAANKEDWPKKSKSAPVPLATTFVDSVVYKRTYQIPMPQQRAREFTFQLQRNYSKIEDISLRNLEANRPIQEGFYFLLSGFWVDYQDKAGI